MSKQANNLVSKGTVDAIEAEIVEIEKVEEGKNQNIAMLEKSQKAINAYLSRGIVSDFSAIPTTFKLSVLQETPKGFIKRRDISGKPVPYVAHEYAEKALNFCFNFNVSSEVVEITFEEYKEKFFDYKDKRCSKDEYGKIIPLSKERTVYEARLHMRFKIKNPDTGEIIVRDVFPSAKGYENIATTKGNTIQSAASRGWTICARTFGIGADIKEAEERAYSRVEASQNYKGAQQINKSVGPNY